MRSTTKQWAYSLTAIGLMLAGVRASYFLYHNQDLIESYAPFVPAIVLVPLPVLPGILFSYLAEVTPFGRKVSVFGWILLGVVLFFVVSNYEG